ncbi:FAD-binding oxidoreductase [Stenomitos frigidus ULC18]|uniref:FAD-binding oxidoreductase n=2 Tax=Stenomitos TaxID=1844270 RepID=A0A2T1EGP0_9CYAN|nr:FAD-binding oxidoreductase [Stenomitos frigidus ULC18]
MNSAENSADLQPTLQGSKRLVEAIDVQDWDALPSGKKTAIRQAVTPETALSSVAYPDTPAALAAVVTATDHQYLLPCGGGSKLHWGGLVKGRRAESRGQKDGKNSLLVVSTERLNRLVEHAVGDLTVTVEAGMRFTDLQATLAKAGQFLAIDPAYPDRATIGGIVATADTGSLRQRYNSVRDMLLGLSFVRADGQSAKAGGRVVKNVAGYDLMKLFTGSYGTLGIITQVTFRVYPLPEASQTIVLSGAASAIAQATQTLLSSALTPASADVLSDSMAAELAIAGTALAIRFQSILPSVQEQSQRMVAVGQALGLTSVCFADADDTALWQRVQKHMTADNQTDAITCKIGIRPSEAVALLSILKDVAIAPWFGQIHMASGLGRLVLNATSPSETLLKLRSICQAKSGFLSVLQAPIECKQAIDVWGYSGNALPLMRQLKQQFDPDGRLSPHRFVSGI